MHFTSWSPATPEQTSRPSRPFTKFLFAQMCAQLADGIMSVALMWLASTLTRDPALLSLIALMSLLPWIIISLPAGVIADRVDRRRLIAWTDALRAAVLLGLGITVALVAGQLPSPEMLANGLAQAPAHAAALLMVLYVVAVVLGTAEVLRDNTAQTLLPALVADEDLEKANGRLIGTEAVLNRFVGPPLAGALIAVGIAVPFLLNAMLYAAAAVLIFSLRLPVRVVGEQREPAPASSMLSSSWRSELTEGLRWLWSHRLLRILALLLGVTNFLSATALVLFVLFVQEVLGLLEGWQFGLLMTGIAAGSTVGALLADRITARVPPGVVLTAGIVGMAVAQLLIGLSTSPILVWALLFVAGFTIALWNVVTVSLRQRIVPDRLLGRVNSAYRLFGWGSMALAPIAAALIVGGLEPVIGRDLALRAPLVITGALGLVCGAVAAPRIRTSRIRAAQEAARG